MLHGDWVVNEVLTTSSVSKLQHYLQVMIIALADLVETYEKLLTTNVL